MNFWGLLGDTYLLSRLSKSCDISLLIQHTLPQKSQENGEQESKRSGYTGDESGVKTIKSSMSLAEYFNSKKAQSIKTTDNPATAGSSFRFEFKTTTENTMEKSERVNLKPKTKKQRTKRTED